MWSSALNPDRSSEDVSLGACRQSEHLTIASAVGPHQATLKSARVEGSISRRPSEAACAPPRLSPPSACPPSSPGVVSSTPCRRHLRSPRRFALSLLLCPRTAFITLVAARSSLQKSHCSLSKSSRAADDGAGPLPARSKPPARASPWPFSALREPPPDRPRFRRAQDQRRQHPVADLEASGEPATRARRVRTADRSSDSTLAGASAARSVRAPSLLLRSRPASGGQRARSRRLEPMATACVSSDADPSLTTHRRLADLQLPGERVRPPFPSPPRPDSSFMTSSEALGCVYAQPAHSTAVLLTYLQSIPVRWLRAIPTVRVRATTASRACLKTGARATQAS